MPIQDYSDKDEILHMLFGDWIQLSEITVDINSKGVNQFRPSENPDWFENLIEQAYIKQPR